MPPRRPLVPPLPPLDEGLAPGRIPTRAIAGFVLAAATPTVVVAGLVPTGIAVTGGNGFPATFVLIAAVLVLFAVPYLAAARRFPPAEASGAFYTIIRRGLGRITGVGAGWVAVGAYLALGLGLYGLIGSIAAPLIADLTGVTVAWQVIAVPAVVITGVLGVCGITASTRILTVLVALEIAMILTVGTANWAHPSSEGAGQAAASLVDPQVVFGSVAVTAARLALGVLGYTGTELTVIHSLTARDRHRGVIHATYAALAILTAVYILGSSSLTATLGPAGVAAAAAADPGGLFVGTAHTNLGATAALIVRMLFVTSLMAGMISFHTATSRYAFFLGRDRTAPAILGRPGRRYGEPVTASLLQTTLALITILLVSLLHADPVLSLFYIGGTAGAVGALILFALTAIAATRIFLRDRAGSRPWLLSVSLAASVVLCVLVATVLLQLGTLLGTPPGSPLPTLVRLTYAGIFTAGCGWAWWLRARHPHTYRDIATSTNHHQHQHPREHGL
ncbi:APC family permease [Amycolatopsis sp. PS_44_ISF1]|uniref:APC family permease n=1 Tax=Amycolatopsis sp. PS_44_ISF1 TaxID=2974917 RepID=UPI0028DFA0C9|nr:APC family permease [Amycolatopsis sp. PS_44_ISF1]MDT8913553.1 APC family permease [Amycolatopsis sp. PS_44_ISF1]